MSVRDGKPPRIRPVAAALVLVAIAVVGFAAVWSARADVAVIVAVLTGSLAVPLVMKALFPDAPEVPGPPSGGATGRLQSFVRDVPYFAVLLIVLFLLDLLGPDGSGGRLLKFTAMTSLTLGWLYARGPVGPPTPPEVRRELLGALMLPLAALAVCLALPALAWSLGWISGPVALLSAPLLAAALTLGMASGPPLVGLWFVTRPRLDGRHAVAIRRSRWRMHLGILRASQVTALLASGDVAGAEARFVELFGADGWGGLVPYLQLTIGRVLVAKGELRDGLLLLERSVTALDDSVAPGDELAVARLLDGQDPTLALEAADAALAHNVIPRPFGFIGYDPRAEQHAARAWALAASGRADEAHAAMREAERRSNPRLVAKAAEVRWRLARARLALGDPEGAAAEARKGVADVGLYGNLCRELVG